MIEQMNDKYHKKPKKNQSNKTCLALIVKKKV